MENKMSLYEKYESGAVTNYTGYSTCLYTSKYDEMQTPGTVRPVSKYSFRRNRVNVCDVKPARA